MGMMKTLYQEIQDQEENEVPFLIENEIQNIHNSYRTIKGLVENHGIDFTKFDKSLEELERGLAEIVALNQELHMNNMELQGLKHGEIRQ